MPIFAASAAASEVLLDELDELEAPDEPDELELPEEPDVLEPPEELDEPELPEALDEPEELDELVSAETAPEETDALSEEEAPPPQAVRPSDTARRRANPIPGERVEFIRPYSRVDGDFRLQRERAVSGRISWMRASAHDGRGVVLHREAPAADADAMLAPITLAFISVSSAARE